MRKVCKMQFFLNIRLSLLLFPVVIQVAPKGRSEAELHIRDLNMTFFFSHIHFHWNAADGQKGSEHRIDGIGYDMEMHLVHYRDSFPNVETALKSNTSNLAAVVGVFVNVNFTPFSTRKI